MTNSRKLKARMLEKGISRNTLSKALNISLTSLSYKLNNKRQFTASEICTICDILAIPSAEISEYFFNK